MLADLLCFGWGEEELMMCQLLLSSAAGRWFLDIMPALLFPERIDRSTCLGMSISPNTQS